MAEERMTGTLGPGGGDRSGERRRRGSSGIGGRRWGSGKFEFDTEGVKKFTTEIGHAEKAMGKFLGQFKELEKVLGRLDQKKIDALATMGGGGGGIGSNRNGGDVSFTRTDSHYSQGSNETPSQGKAAPAPAQRDEQSQNTGRFGGLAGAYFGTQLAASAVQRLSAFGQGDWSFGVQADYANSLTMARTGMSRQRAQGAPSWQQLRGYQNAEDMAAVQLQMSSLFGPGQRAGAGAAPVNWARSSGAMNMLNPAFGSGSAASQAMASSFINPQAMWAMQSYGMRLPQIGGNVQSQSQIIGDLMLRATGQTKFGAGGLTEEMARSVFTQGGQATLNLQALTGGQLDPEIMQMIVQNPGLIARFGGDLSRAANAPEMRRGSRYWEERESTAQRAGHDIEKSWNRRTTDVSLEQRERELRDSLRDITDAFDKLLPYVERLSGVFGSVVEGAAMAAGALSAFGVSRGKLPGLGRRGAPKAPKAPPGQGVLPGTTPRSAGGLKAGGAAAIGQIIFDTAFDVEGGANLRAMRSWEAYQENAEAYQENTLGAKLPGPSFGDLWEGASNFFSKRKGLFDIGDAVQSSNPFNADLPGGGREEGLDTDFRARLARLFQAAQGAGHRLTLTSGFRTRKEQERLYAKYLAGTGNLAAKPGTSRHESGRAADIGVNGGRISGTPAARWLKENAAKFGLHLPVKGEPWHVEPIGAGSGISFGTGKSGEDGGVNEGVKKFSGFTPKHSWGKTTLSGTAPNFEHSFDIGGVIGSAVGSLADKVKGAIGGGGSVSQKQAYDLALGAGFSPSQARIMAAIAMGESSGNPGAHNPNAGTGDNSYGLWQINMLGSMGPSRRKAFGISSNEQLFDPSTNARAAKSIFDSQGFNAWSVYKSGKYKQYLGGEVGDPVSEPAGGGGGVSVGGNRTTVTVQNLNLNIKLDQVTEAEAIRLTEMIRAKLTDDDLLAKIGRS